MAFIENPSEDSKIIWGVLAHVDKDERERIMNLPFGQFKPAVNQIEKQIEEIEKKKKKKESIYKQIRRLEIKAESISD